VKILKHAIKDMSAAENERDAHDREDERGMYPSIPLDLRHLKL
jgi:hypothetical protein